MKNDLHAGFALKLWLNMPVYLHQMPPGPSRHEYEMTAAISSRLRFFASSPNVFRA